MLTPRHSPGERIKQEYRFLGAVDKYDIWERKISDDFHYLYIACDRNYCVQGFNFVHLLKPYLHLLVYEHRNEVMQLIKLFGEHDVDA